MTSTTPIRFGQLTTQWLQRPGVLSKDDQAVANEFGQIIATAAQDDRSTIARVIKDADAAGLDIALKADKPKLPQSKGQPTQGPLQLLVGLYKKGTSTSVATGSQPIGVGRALKDAQLPENKAAFAEDLFTSIYPSIIGAMANIIQNKP